LNQALSFLSFYQLSHEIKFYTNLSHWFQTNLTLKRNTTLFTSRFAAIIDQSAFWSQLVNGRDLGDRWK